MLMLLRPPFIATILTIFTSRTVHFEFEALEKKRIKISLNIKNIVS